MTEANVGTKAIDETFEQWINRTMCACDIEGVTEVKELIRLRDNGRVCFVENKKKFSDLEDVLGNGTLSAAEVALVEADLEKFANRARKYLARYDYASHILKAFRDIEAHEKANAKAVKDVAEATEILKRINIKNILETMTGATTAQTEKAVEDYFAEKV